MTGGLNPKKQFEKNCQINLELNKKMRSSEFGSPFRNEGSGRPENDSENKSRYKAGLDGFIAQEKGKISNFLQNRQNE